MKNTKIISGFPGVGKSYLFKNNTDLIILDSDSSEFSWIKDENGDNTKERNPKFPTNYMQHIKDNIGKADIIMVSSHDVVRKALKENSIKYYIVYPAKYSKLEYMRRYKERGNNEGFINFINANWDKFIDDIENDDFPIHIKLSDDSYYLKDIFTTPICNLYKELCTVKLTNADEYSTSCHNCTNKINYFKREKFIIELNIGRRKYKKF